MSVAAAVLVGLALPPLAAYADDPPESTTIAGTAEDYNTVHTASDGDLWASCQSDDGALYAANGDGTGFDLGHPHNTVTEDIVVNRITGTPAVQNSVRGQVVAIGGDPKGGPGKSVGEIWSGLDFNRKPTGMLCVGGDLYLAVQDLRKQDFGAAPAASILLSHDHGRTWFWNREKMFDTQFTTIFFADYGRDSVNAPDPNFLYAYGLDETWAGRTKLFLARFPRNGVLDRQAWQWWTGTGWSIPGDMDSKQPVIEDTRPPAGRISQGGVVYDKPLGKYIYSSWIEHTDVVTFQFYESPTPWGPWSVFLFKNFLSKCFDHHTPRWNPTFYGGYATTIPSKFISSDGRTLWVQSNVLFIFDENNPDSCPAPQPDLKSYGFSLRRMWITTSDNLVRDPGFEGQQRFQVVGLPLPIGPVGPPWTTEGPDAHGIDSGLGLSHQGTYNAWIHPANRASRAWNAITQEVPVKPHTRYTVSGWVQTSGSLTDGFFGVRNSDGRTVLQETRFGPAGPYTRLSVTFDSGDNDKVTLFAGYWAPGSDSWLRFDDATLGPA
ncbi:MAG: hypothetical protein AUI14_12425 [Actinobacteria bacterium 13_2_20CM_2_71_6]|nr:MAG: hypothetical protein AUI14_12425 [Actinobacteria bacterium 13_2_20CM_2_71_6]